MTALDPPAGEPVADGAPSAESPARRQRARRWARRIGLGLLAAFLATNALSLVFNLATQPPAQLDPGFGGYIRAGSSDVHYQQWGDRGSPIVLVPGFLESSIVWSAVGPLLGAHHRVFALDLPGHGYTRYAGPMTLRDQAALVDGFIRALHLQRPLLVGHSLGAAVIASVALAHPHDTSGVVFADGDGLPISLGPRWLRALLIASPYATSVLRLAERWTWAVRTFITSSCSPGCSALTTALVHQWVRPLDQQSDENALRDLMVTADYGLTGTQISAIPVPAEIIWGSDDHQGGSLAATITNLHHPPVHMIANAGHLTMLANPAAFARAVETAPTVH